MRGSFSIRIVLAIVLGGCVLEWTPVAVSQPKALSRSPKKHSAAKGPAPLAVSLPSTPSTPPVQPAPQAPVSLLQEPPKQAQIKLDSQGLYIQAENSDLSQILRDVASSSGMKLEGLGRNQRIFGNYGPGAPKDVLSKLLEGTGYNVLMVGETEQGTPRELVLMPRTGGSAPGNFAASQPPVRQANQEDEDTAADSDEEPQQPPPPQAAPFRPSGNEQTPNGVKTPQQLLEELRRLREQNQNPPQNNGPQ